MGRNLDIPPPILKEHKAEYLKELSNIKESEDWIKKHSKTLQPSEELEYNFKPIIQTSEEGQLSSSPNTALFRIIAFMLMLSFYILFVPSEDTIEFFLIQLNFVFFYKLISMVNPNKSNQTEKSQTNSEKELSSFLSWLVVVILACLTLFAIFFLILISLIESSFSGGCYGVCGLSGWGGGGP